jgi:hypothetical protein
VNFSSPSQETEHGQLEVTDIAQVVGLEWCLSSSPECECGGGLAVTVQGSEENRCGAK